MKYEIDSFCEQEIKNTSTVSTDDSILKIKLEIFAKKLRNSGKLKTEIITKLHDKINTFVENGFVIGSTQLINYVSTIIDKIYDIKTDDIIRNNLKYEYNLSNNASDYIFKKYEFENIEITNLLK